MFRKSNSDCGRSLPKIFNYSISIVGCCSKPNNGLQPRTLVTTGWPEFVQPRKLGTTSCPEFVQPRKLGTACWPEFVWTRKLGTAVWIEFVLTRKRPWDNSAAVFLICSRPHSTFKATRRPYFNKLNCFIFQGWLDLWLVYAGPYRRYGAVSSSSIAL